MSLDYMLYYLQCNHRKQITMGCQMRTPSKYRPGFKNFNIGYTGRIDTFYRICIKYITPIGMLLVLAGQVNEFFSLNWF